MGVSAVDPTELDGANAIDLVITRAARNLDTRFLYWFLRWPTTLGLMDAAELDAQAARIDDILADANRLKALRAERRSTLITDVVTGTKEVPA